MNPFPENGIMAISHREDAGFQFLTVGVGRICHPYL